MKDITVVIDQNDVLHHIATLYKFWKQNQYEIIPYNTFTIFPWTAPFGLHIMLSNNYQ